MGTNFVRQFEERTFTEGYISRYGEEVTEEFTICIRPVKQWLLEMAKDPIISRLMEWYPRKKYINIGGTEEEFRDDLDGGIKWWEIQVGWLASYTHCPSHDHCNWQDKISADDPDGIFVPLIAYSDATSLAKFNNRKFHPVNLRIAGIPASLRNTYQRGGCTLIGNIPVVSTHHLSTFLHE